MAGKVVSHDYMVMLLRPLHHGPRHGWVQTTCPYCGQPVWDTDPMGVDARKMANVTDVVYRACGDCSDKKAWELQAVSRQMILNL